MAAPGLIAAEADRAHAIAAELVAPEHWSEAEAPTFDSSDQFPARVWRRAKALVVDGGPAPFKTQGVPTTPPLLDTCCHFTVCVCVCVYVCVCVCVCVCVLSSQFTLLHWTPVLS